jgi:hypothetical protein
MHPTIQKYKEAWEQRNVKLLKDIFTPDAIYQYRPWEAASGLLEIEKYWAEKIIERQTSVSFHVERERHFGNELWLEWNAVVGLKDRAAPVKLTGTMIIELAEDGRIKRLVEYYFY